jgi:4-diphosphocytidyl-2-C-methyl-D-erythritol kinase
LNLRLVAPAKINFGLRVQRRRADGYHELESVFLPLDLADELQLEVDEAVVAAPRLELDPPRADVPSGPQNLVLRAAEAFCSEARLECAVRVRLAKHIPAAAGLGGGSSDAGAVLRGLAQRFPSAVSPPALERLALALGSMEETALLTNRQPRLWARI